MLGDATHALSLHAADIVDAELADKVRVLAEGLVGAAPAGVPGDVDHRAHGGGDAHAAALLADDAAHLLRQLWLPGAPQVGHGREQSAAGGGVSAQVFRLQRYGDAQAGLLYKILLHDVGDLGDLHRVHQAHDGVLGEPAVAVGKLLPQSVHIHLAVHDERGGQVAAQLGGLLLQGHAGEQILHPLRGGQRFVPVVFHVFPPWFYF